MDRRCQVIPVLDVLDGVAVHAVAGRREEYRPLESVLTDSTDPITVARAVRERLGLSELYLADLDAILHGQRNPELYSALLDDGFDLLLDAGVRTVADASELVAVGVPTVIVGLETVDGPIELRNIVEAHGERVLFSLDSRDGEPLGDSASWPSDPFAIGSLVVRMGVRRVLVLDLARVGMGQGTGTEELCHRLVTKYRDVEVLAGGGIKSEADLSVLEDVGVAGALVGSAIHREGGIGR